jgi:hypothetical protein
MQRPNKKQGKTWIPNNPQQIRSAAEADMQVRGIPLPQNRRLVLDPFINTHTPRQIAEMNVAQRPISELRRQHMAAAKAAEAAEAAKAAEAAEAAEAAKEELEIQQQLAAINVDQRPISELRRQHMAAAKAEHPRLTEWEKYAQKWEPEALHQDTVFVPGAEQVEELWGGYKHNTSMWFNHCF